MPDVYYLQNAHERVQTLVEHITKLTLARDILARECSEAKRAFEKRVCKETDFAIFLRKASEKLTGAETRIENVIAAFEPQLVLARSFVETETRFFDTEKRNEELQELLAIRAQFERAQSETEGMLK